MKNRIFILLTVITICCIIAIPTYFNLKKNHEEKLKEVIRNEVITASKKCFLDNVCTGESTTLRFLYEKKYLNKIIDPSTKKYYDESSIIYYKDKKIDLNFI